MMKMISRIFIFVGLICVTFSVCLFINNEKQEKEFEVSTNNLLCTIFSTMEKNQAENKPQKLDFSQNVNQEISINNNVYSFILNIPSLNLRLPVQKNWSYNNLKISPCIYQSEPLSIAAHNFKSQFGRLNKLKVGETINIEYFSGVSEKYVVVGLTKIHENNTEKLNDFNYDLSLFTCNYSNNNERILVRLNKVKL